MTPFPLPKDPAFLRETVEIWLEDIDVQLSLGRTEIAKDSWKKANETFQLIFPVAERTEELLEKLEESRVKLDQLHTKQST